MSDQQELDIVKPETKDLQVQSETGMLLKLAMDKGLDIAVFEKLIELQNQQDDKKCKREFDFNFGEMQKEFEPIDKTKDSYSSKYAPLPLMIKKYGSIISKHGFSFKWRESAIDTGKRVTIIISGWGHTDDTTYFDIPTLKSTGSQNAVQVAAAMSTYGNRYTFKSGFGITEIDEDTDGNLTFDDGVQYADQANTINNCNTVDELKSVWADTWKNLGTDTIGKQILTIVYNKRKKVVMSK